MYIILRTIRAFIGLVAAIQFVGTSRSIGDYIFGTGASNETIVFILLKITILLVLAGLFVGMRSMINKLYLRKYNTDHPAFTSPWSL